MIYKNLVNRLRKAAGPAIDFPDTLYDEAADAIEELLKAAKAMHTWIFLNSGDEQAAYDECGLSDEMNAVLGYSGQYIVEPPKEEI